MHTVLDGDSSLSPQTPKGAQPPSFGPYQQWRNGWMDRDATWQEGRPLPKRHCVRWGPSSPPKKRGKDPQFSAHGYCGQTTGWIKLALGTGVGLGPGHIVLDGDPAPPPQKGHSPNFRPISIVAKLSTISATAEHLLHNSGQRVPLLYMGRHFSPLKDGGIWTPSKTWFVWAHPHSMSQTASQYFQPFFQDSRSSQADRQTDSQTDLQRDHATPPVTVVLRCCLEIK